MSDEAAPTPAPEQAKPEPEQKAADTSGLQRNYQRALDEAKKVKEENKLLAARLAEALPYVEKFKGHDEAKALEAQRESEARANQEKEQRAQQEVAAKKERAILRTLLGVPMPTEDAADYAYWKLVNDPAVAYDPESGSFTGLTEAKARLLELPLFTAGKPAEPVKRVAPGLPVTTGGKPPAAPPAKTYSELWQDPAAAEAYRASNPIEYEQLKRAHMASQSVPRSQVFPGPGVMK